MTTHYVSCSRVILAWFCTGLAACTVPNPDYKGDAKVCVAETDAEFCSRIGATCEQVTRDDNCGKSRTTVCGICTGADSCVANVCKAPVCSAFSFPRMTLVDALNDPTKQDTLAGVSADGKTVLWQRGACVAPLQLLIGDSNGAGFAIADLSAQPALSPIAVGQDGALALTADGLSIIGVSSDGRSFWRATRATRNTSAFGTASNADFVALNVNAPARVDFPALSADGLAFYFHRVSSANPVDNGIYESVRSSTTAPFPAATKLSGLVQSYATITAISSDRLAIFVESSPSSQVSILTRRSLSEPFTNPNASGPPPTLMAGGLHTRPLGDCQSVMTTYSFGDCVSQQIAILSQ